MVSPRAEKKSSDSCLAVSTGRYYRSIPASTVNQTQKQTTWPFFKRFCSYYCSMFSPSFPTEKSQMCHYRMTLLSHRPTCRHIGHWTTESTDVTTHTWNTCCLANSSNFPGLIQYRAQSKHLKSS